jgi:F-type H+-transporting ATPase subunit gamma
MPSEPLEPSIVLVPISSDKGLCGAVNSTIVREIKKIVKHAPQRNKIKIFSIGYKGSTGLLRPFPDLL